MIGWLVFVGYLVGYVVTARLIARAIIQHNEREYLPPDPEANVLLRAMACLIALVWPLVAFGAIVTGRLPKTDQQIRRELDERERRISELERDLGIGHHDEWRGWRWS